MYTLIAIARFQRLAHFGVSAPYSKIAFRVTRHVEIVITRGKMSSLLQEHVP